MTVGTSILDRGPVGALLRRALRGRSIIFMLHRFADPELGSEGHDPEGLRRLLGWLRKTEREVVPLREVFMRLETGDPPLNGAIAFTLDDGYVDQGSVAAPIFAEFDCPATTFVATDFIDGKMWYWWDQVAYLFATSNRTSVTLDPDGGVRVHPESQAPGSGARECIAACKELSPDRRSAFLHDLQVALDVELPEAPPSRYAAMDWQDIRSCERAGMSFGPHTLTHPILSRCAAEESRHEIQASWTRLTEEATDPDPIFCYPNGTAADFGGRENRIVAELGLRGAVSAFGGYAVAEDYASEDDYRFQVPRYPYSQGERHNRDAVTGRDWLKDSIRGLLRA